MHRYMYFSNKRYLSIYLSCRSTVIYRTTSISLCLVQCVICHMGYMWHVSSVTFLQSWFICHVTCHLSDVLYAMHLPCVLCTLVWILMCWSKITFWRKNFAHTLHLRQEDIIYILTIFNQGTHCCKWTIRIQVKTPNFFRNILLCRLLSYNLNFQKITPREF